VIQLIIAGLEHDRDVVLAHLVIVAVNVRRDAIGKETATIDEFIRRTTNTMMSVGVAEGTGFLQTILEDLVRRDELDEEPPFSGRFSPIGLTSAVPFSAKDNTMEVSFYKILSCFWSMQSDIICHVYRQTFVGGPPIRIIARRETKSPSMSNIYMLNFNRHPQCE
jgi:hypothetical protein